MTVVRFWGSTERGAPVVSIKHVSVWGGPHSAPIPVITSYDGKKWSETVFDREGGRLKS